MRAGQGRAVRQDIAGTLTAHGVNILSADLYTREDGIVLDTFKISQAGSHTPVKADKWPRIDEHLKAAIEGRYDVGAAVKKWLGEFHVSNRRRRADPSGRRRCDSTRTPPPQARLWK